MKLLWLILLITSSFLMLAVYNGKKESSTAYTEAKEMIVLRKVVHDLLLASGDSISRVLPVQQISANEFHLYPEKSLSINPDSFVNIVKKTIREGKLLRDFTASVVKCKGKETVYGFAASTVASENVTACLGTKLPEDCYYISFIFSPVNQSFFVSNYLYWLLTPIIILTIFFIWKNKKPQQTASPSAPKIPAAEEDKQEPLLNENNIPIGKYIFNPAQLYLQLDEEKTVLTIKECKVLSILANNINTIVERETLQKEVWENEGVIVTRSLDMFISKLRKKLSGDPAIKIMNVHGKGYKLCLE